jgi:hypothetical protein
MPISDDEKLAILTYFRSAPIACLLLCEILLEVGRR